MNPETMRKIAMQSHLGRETDEEKFEINTPIIPGWVSKIICEYKIAFNVFGALKDIHEKKESDIYRWVFSDGNVDKFTIAYVGKYGLEK